MVITQPSLTEIEAIKLQYKPLFGQSNGSMAGVAIGGFNFMYVFTKDFWDKKGRERRARTLEVLKPTVIRLPSLFRSLYYNSLLIELSKR